jgi:esterase/lipase superfamily enzyme
MDREYLKWESIRLGREMEMLLFGHAGLPVLVFPTSGGRFFEFEDRGMVATLADKVEAGQLQLFCVDSVDMESWYNRSIPPRERIERQMQYEQYILDEVTPLIRRVNSDPRLTALGCSLGGYHAVNIALRHPEVFSGLVSLSGAFDLTSFLDGYYDQDCYYNLPTHYLPNLSDPRYIDLYKRGNYLLASGWDDHCLAQSQELDRIMNTVGIAHQFYVWEANNSHDWPTWQRMAREYL